MAGKNQLFDGYLALFVALCHMKSFACIEPLSSLNSTTFAKTLMNIMLRFKFAHTIKVDAESN